MKKTFNAMQRAELARQIAHVKKRVREYAARGDGYVSQRNILDMLSDNNAYVNIMDMSTQPYFDGDHDMWLLQQEINATVFAAVRRDARKRGKRRGP